MAVAASNRKAPQGRNRWNPGPIGASSRDVVPWLEHPTLAGIRERLQLSFDCWNLLDCPDGSSRRSIYLPPGAKEPAEAYRRRLEAAKPTGFFRDALRTYAGMLSHCQWLNLPASLLPVLTDVDGRGTDLGVFLFLADLLVLRDGGCLILQLPPLHRWPSEGDRLTAISRGDRLSLPRFLLIPRGDLLNWRLPNADGLPVEISWREMNPAAQQPLAQASVPVQILNAHGSLLPDQGNWIYRNASLTDDGLLLRSWKLEPDPITSPNGTSPNGVSPSGASANGASAAQQLLRATTPELFRKQQQLPAFWYTADGAAFGEGDLPHLGLANQYLNHYRCKSEYEDLLSRTALPVGVRKGLVDEYGFCRDPNGNPSSPQQLTLSTNTFMDLPVGVDFEWVEIEAKSLAEHRAYLELLDDAMRRDALIPSQNRGSGRSDTEVSLTAGQSYALLQSLAKQKSSLFSSLLLQWCRLTGDRLGEGAGLSISVTPLMPPPRPLPTVSEWLQLHERQVISSEELRQQLAISTSAGQTKPIDTLRALL